MVSSSFLIFLAGIFLESLSIAFRSFSLGFRLFANVSAGHVLGDIFSCVKFSSFGSISAFFGSTFYAFFLLAYEAAVSVVQVSVFIALVGVYAA